MPDIASVLLVFVGLGALVPHIQDRISQKVRVWVFIILSIVGVLGVISNAMQRERSNQEMLGAITGGDSFCYVDFGGWASDELIANLMQVGKFDVPDVRVTITDLDAFHTAQERNKISESDSYRKAFPVIPLVSRISLFRGLTTYQGRGYRQFNIEVFFRNGAVTELARVNQDSKGWAMAIIVAASYLDGRKGIVLEKIGRDFPRSLLTNDPDWINFSNLRRLDIAKP